MTMESITNGTIKVVPLRTSGDESNYCVFKTTHTYLSSMNYDVLPHILFKVDLLAW